MKFVYECWKCGEWHTDTAGGAWNCLVNGYARPGIVVAGIRVTLPRPVFVLWANLLSDRAIAKRLRAK
jgi:hypothetical protein